MDLETEYSFCFVKPENSGRLVEIFSFIGDKIGETGDYEFSLPLHIHNVPKRYNRKALYPYYRGYNPDKATINAFTEGDIVLFLVGGKIFVKD